MSYSHIPALILITILPVFSNLLKGVLGFSENSLDFTELTRRNGYHSENYDVKTEDGYILNLYRLNNKKCKVLVRPPVFLMHGLLFSSDSWLDSGVNASLAYMLADNCYDLWVGNRRGSSNGRRHVWLNPDKDKEFWNFCVDDTGYHDIPAQIDKVLEITGARKLNYIGFSQGCAEVAIACSERPEYVDKVQLFIALAPALKMKNTRSAVSRLTSQAINILNPVLTILGIYELFFKGSVLQRVLEFTCKRSLIAVPICLGFITVLDSYDPGSISLSTTTKLYTHFPAGTSKKTLVKYYQALHDEDFRKFDYGAVTNVKLYGSEEPPKFNLKRLKFPVVLVQGLNDYIVDPKDVQWLRDRLPNVLELKIVDDPSWDHSDVIYSSYSPKLLLPTVNMYLRQYSAPSSKRIIRMG